MNVLRASSVKGCVKQEHKISAGREFEAQKKILNRFGLVRGERDRRQEAWARKMRLLFCCAFKEEKDGDELASVCYFNCSAFG